jgi:hypothetical protein
MTFKRTDRYKAAINEVADAIAEMPIKELNRWGLCGMGEVGDDLEAALEKRHRKFMAEVERASDAALEERQARRRSEGARKAAATRAKQRAAAKEQAAQT